MNEVRKSIFKYQFQTRRHKPDYILVLLSLILLAVGLIVVYGIRPVTGSGISGNESYYVSRQLIAVGLGVVAFAVTANLPPQYWRKLEKPLIISSAIAVVAVALFGQEVNGANRWFQIGGLSFQVVELVKFTLIIWLAGFLADRLRQGELRDKKRTFNPILAVLGGLVLLVAGLQSDLGSLGVIVAIMGTMIFVIGLPMKRLVLVASLVAVGAILLVASSGYRRERLDTFLHPTKDCVSTGYQACQALITVGSGGIFGLGIARSVQANGYLPGAADDSIFAIVAEKFGFLGITALLGAFMMLFGRLKNIIVKAPDTYSRLLITGVLAWISTQMIINVGAMIGLLPLKGITLPFISYGGTSVLFITAAIGLAFQVSRYTTYGHSSQDLERSTYDNRLDRRGVRGAYHPNSSSR